MMPWITLFTSLVLFVINTPEGVCDESSNGGQFEGCLWTWSEWTTCDPGLCNQPRNVKDRIRNILQVFASIVFANLQFVMIELL